MKVPKIDKFLFYFKLRTGAFFIAGWNIFISIALIIVGSIYFTRMLIFFNSLNEQDKEFFRVIVNGEKFFSTLNFHSNFFPPQF